MLKYKILLFVLFINTASFAYVTSADKPTDSIPLKFNNSILIEVFGGNMSLSLNYERTIISFKKFFLNFRLGFGTLIIISSFTYSSSCYFGKNNNYFEFGFGRTDIFLPSILSARPDYYYYPVIGYRYQKKYVFKLQLLYYMTQNENNKSIPFFGIGFGRAF